VPRRTDSLLGTVSRGGPPWSPPQTPLETNLFPTDDSDRVALQQSSPTATATAIETETEIETAIQQATATGAL
jgi:hypothetical protein